MKIIADLHIHGRFSRGCSKDLSFKNLEKYARLKGIDLIGTGDFSHPRWLEEIKKLEDDGSGFLRTKDNFPFVLQNEYSLIYTQGGKGRRVHLCFLAPSIDVVEQINEQMLRIGRLDYDGRPIFKLTCEEFVENMMSISKDIEVFPAHIWTPWFSMFGSKSGFGSMKECFGSQFKNVHAIETGLSSDPQMNWRIKELDSKTILSTSDTHSYWPWRIGREATVFDIKQDYRSLIRAIRTQKGIIETIEVDPNYGKYHVDGHRKCNVMLHPKDSLKLNNICPVCKKPLTVGVLQRVEELAKRPEDYWDSSRPGFRTMIPLHDLLSLLIGKGVATKAVWQEYHKILSAGKNENDILMHVPEEKLLKVTAKKIAEGIILNRAGKIKVKPGYDGVYGEPMMDKDATIRYTKIHGPGMPKPAQKGVGDFF